VERRSDRTRTTSSLGGTQKGLDKWETNMEAGWQKRGRVQDAAAIGRPWAETAHNGGCSDGDPGRPVSGVPTRPGTSQLRFLVFCRGRTGASSDFPPWYLAAARHRHGVANEVVSPPSGISSTQGLEVPGDPS
jgi:hypothetical protein